jgi:hypothetical protein
MTDVDKIIRWELMCFVSFFLQVKQNTGEHVFWVKSGDGDAYPDAGGSRRATKRAMVHVVHGKIEIDE